jgi:hypothetical protein
MLSGIITVVNHRAIALITVESRNDFMASFCHGAGVVEMLLRISREIVEDLPVWAPLTG